VAQALSEVGADFVADLPHGLDTVLGDGGAGLSTGQRQRLALARAFLRQVPLVLLDEPTAGLDGVSEQQVVDAVRRLARSRTVVLVAHRPALVELADDVVALDTSGVPA
jgi:ATP-binding cassette subfamily C protein CydCD